MKILSKKTENGITTMDVEIANPYDGKRIYCVIADTVQHPLDEVMIPFTKTYPLGRTYKRNELTRTIEQVPGRALTQGEHAVGKVRHMMVRDEIHRAHEVAAKNKRDKVWYLGQKIMYHPITTINLMARDSYELYHIRGLLNAAQIKYQLFLDENPPVYGEGKVFTAIATYPVTPDEVTGIMDYLPLWKPRKIVVPAPTLDVAADL
jgi:hypothetical protein